LNNFYVKLGIWIAVIAAVFAYLWSKGHLLRLSTYVQETREELKKCTWPSWDELKGSTLVVMISTLLLGIFIVAVDYAILMFVRFIQT
jgi:preprotein translocase subunit SecE